MKAYLFDLLMRAFAALIGNGMHPEHDLREEA